MATLKMPVWPAPAYDRDFHAWSQDQAARLRRGRPASVDWENIDEHRDRIARILDESPSLAAWPNEVLAAEYQRARRKALRDTGLPMVTVPAVSPFSAEQIIDPDYWPD